MYASAAMADEKSVLNDLERAHQGWVKFGHFYGPRYGELLKHRVVLREAQDTLGCRMVSVDGLMKTCSEFTVFGALLNR